MTPLLVDANGAADLLGVGRRTFFELRARPDFVPAIVLSQRAVRYRVADLQAWLMRQAGTAHRPEPAHLAAGKARRRRTTGGTDGGLAGGLQTPIVAKPRRARPAAEGSGIEPPAGGNSNRRAGGAE